MKNVNKNLDKQRQLFVGMVNLFIETIKVFKKQYFCHRKVVKAAKTFLKTVKYDSYSNWLFRGITEDLKYCMAHACSHTHYIAATKEETSLIDSARFRKQRKAFVTFLNEIAETQIEIYVTESFESDKNAIRIDIILN